MTPFPWRPGMQFRSPHHPGHVATVEHITNGGRSLATAAGWSARAASCTPVDSGATRGELLDAVREAWGDPSMYVVAPTMIRPDGTAPAWFVYTGHGKGPVVTASTEFAALLAAYNAAPRSTS